MMEAQPVPETLAIQSIVTQPLAREILIALSYRGRLKSSLIIAIKFWPSTYTEYSTQSVTCLKISLAGCSYNDKLYHFLF
jgi:hypothetical protein